MKLLGTAGLVWCVLAPVWAIAQAPDAERDFWKAYYLEVEEGNLESAIALYETVAKTPGAPPELAQRAARRLAGSREELRGRDLGRLLPAEALARLEIRSPGKHLARLLRLTGFSGPAERGAGDGVEPIISPKLLEGLQGVEGAALAITDFDFESGIPQGLLLVNLGRNQAIGGLIETALGAASESGLLQPAEAVKGHKTYRGPWGTVVVTERLIIAGSPHERAVEAVERLEAEPAASAEAVEAFNDLKAERADALLFLVVDARRAIAAFRSVAERHGHLPEELQIAQAFLDLESFRWAAFRLGADERTLRADLWLKLEAENHAVAYHLLRTPPIDRTDLRSAPAGIAAVLALGLNEGEAPGAASARAGAAKLASGLDLGREFFANVRSALLFAAAPDAAAEGEHRRPLPDLGLELLVRDPGRSRALWSEILRIGSLLAHGEPQAGRGETIAGQETSVYTFPEGFTVHLASLPDRTLLATSSRAMLMAIRAAQGQETLGQDPAFAPALAAIKGDPGKLLLVDGPRALQLAQAIGALQGKDAGEMAAIAQGTGLSFETYETQSTFQASLQLQPPVVAPFIRQMMHQHGGPGGKHRVTRRAPALEQPAPAEAQERAETIPPQNLQKPPKAPKPPKQPKEGKLPKPPKLPKQPKQPELTPPEESRPEGSTEE